MTGDRGSETERGVRLSELYDSATQQRRSAKERTWTSPSLRCAVGLRGAECDFAASDWRDGGNENERNTADPTQTNHREALETPGSSSISSSRAVVALQALYAG
jgi:hypothetical protein